MLITTPKSSQPWVATLVRTIFEQADATEVTVQFDRSWKLSPRNFPRRPIISPMRKLLAFTAYPRQIWKQIWSSNPQERLNKEIRRRTDVVGIFPDRDAIIRLVGAVLAEQHDEWIETHRYFGLEILTKVDAANGPSDTPEISVAPEALTA
ncbi:transposase [Frankia sp. Cpl3]|nr:transposase [Frankia sp. Cpl3]